ncbi:MAG TPA: hypothetical protein VET26_11230, partial [Candidatus Sulfotelmatobacter sp.]|nr:hypothetical protein [Candidatus Sulfotelmatobacter sp.]
MGPRRPSLIAAALAALILGGCAGQGPGTTAGSAIATSSPSASGCRPGPPEAGVHNPDRLEVLQPCAHAEGVVVDVAHEDDGDYHLWFTPDAAYASLLN